MRWLLLMTHLSQVHLPKGGRRHNRKKNEWMAAIAAPALNRFKGSISHLPDSVTCRRKRTQWVLAKKTKQKKTFDDGSKMLHFYTEPRADWMKLCRIQWHLMLPLKKIPTGDKNICQKIFEWKGIHGAPACPLLLTLQTWAATDVWEKNHVPNLCHKAKKKTLLLYGRLTHWPPVI